MEIEIKLNLNPAIPGGPTMLFTQLSELTHLGGEPLGAVHHLEMRDIYYDTPTHMLAANRGGLRMRVVNGESFITLKMNRTREGALSRRQEYEEVLTQQNLDRTLAYARHILGVGPFPVADFAKGRPCGPLVPVLVIETMRLARSVGEKAELALDLVEYPGSTVQPFFDIEVEARGSLADEKFLRQVEHELQGVAQGYLAPSAQSKLERGMRLRMEAEQRT